MDERDRQLAHIALSHACMGKFICGVHFYDFPILLIVDRGAGSSDESYLRIESKWQVYSELPPQFPRSQEDLPERSIEEFAQVAAQLRSYEIVAAEITEGSPHLLLRFANGQTLFVHGYNWEYECWELSAGPIGVVGGVDNTLAVWLPEDLAPA